MPPFQHNYLIRLVCHVKVLRGTWCAVGSMEGWFSVAYYFKAFIEILRSDIIIPFVSSFGNIVPDGRVDVGWDCIIGLLFIWSKKKALLEE